MNMKKIESYEVHESIDKETGKVNRREEKKVVRIPQEEDYIKVYIKHINYIANIGNKYNSLIYQLMSYMNYRNDIVLVAAIKKEIAKELGLTLNTINRYITQLVEKDILIRKDIGMYILNPYFYGKGKYKDILELREELEINIKYDKNNPDGFVMTHKFQTKKEL